MSILYGPAISRKHPTPARTFDPLEYGKHVWEDIHNAACNVEAHGGMDDDRNTCHKFVHFLRQISESYKCGKCRSHFTEPGEFNDQVDELDQMLKDPLDDEDTRSLCILWASKLHAHVTRALRDDETRRVRPEHGPSALSLKYVKLWDALEQHDLLDLAGYSKELVIEKLRFYKLFLCHFNKK